LQVVYTTTVLNILCSYLVLNIFLSLYANFLSLGRYNISIYRHPRYTATFDTTLQTDALYRGLTVVGHRKEERAKMLRSIFGSERQKVTLGGGKPCNEKLHNLYGTKML
jgi:hypothetical protein